MVITGSPRKRGNSFAMTEAFVTEAKKKGHEITRFDAAFMKIGGCHACAARVTRRVRPAHLTTTSTS